MTKRRMNKKDDTDSGKMYLILLLEILSHYCGFTG
jgi:hypothetical protein